MADLCSYSLYFALTSHSKKIVLCHLTASTDHNTCVVCFLDVEPDESYLVSVFPVYNQLCGSPQSLAASLHQGGKLDLTIVLW